MKTTLLGFLFLIFTSVSAVHAKTAEQWYEQAFEQSINAQYSKAIRSYKQALRLRKDWAQAHHGIAVIYFKLKNGVQAAHHLRKARKLYPENDEINLAIIKRNLEKTYNTFDLDSQEFEELETLHPAGEKESWVTSGKGFLFGDKGYVFTLLHPLGKEEKVQVRFANQAVFSARIVKRYIIYDLALLKLETKTPPKGLAFGDSSLFKEQDSVGFIDSGNKVLTGKMKALRAIMKDENIFELALHGKSTEGMPLLNEKNQAVGIILSSPQITKNFQAAGVAPQGEIALKSSYLERVFSLYISTLEGPKKRGRQSKMKSGKSGGLLSSLAVIEIRK